MAESFRSSDWYRVAPLRPRLRSHVEIHRQRFRNEIWHIVQDQHSGKYHRISPAGNLILSLMDGRRSLQQLWEIVCDRFEDDPPTQSEIIRLLSQLHNADLIAGETLPDIRELGRRHNKQERATMLSRLRNPLALRFPLLDPDAFLTATVGLFRPLFTVWGFLAWLCLVVSGITLAVMNWSALTDDVTDKILTAENLFLVAIAYPLVKALHELGHAYAAKVWGGEVHEIGLMFLVLIPVPYVDASSSAAFPEKWRRAVVGGAGIMVELALAAIAMIFWVNAEPGLARAFAFNVMLIGGVSTLLFNGNPLLRFDGYFVLADLLEIPNMGQRSSKYFWYLVQRYLLGVKKAESPVTARGERGWFLFYSITSFFYRISISIGISLFVATKFFFIGVLLAIWALSNVFVFPIFKGLKFLMTSGSLRGRRAWAVFVTASVVGSIVGFLVVVPLPHATTAQGVVWLGEGEVLRAGTAGFIARIPQERGQATAGTFLVQLEDPVLASETRLAQAQLDELQLRLNSAIATDRTQTSLLREQVRHLTARLALYNERSRALSIVAPHDGLALIPYGADLTGRLVAQGAVLGYLLDMQEPRIRVAVPQARAELVRTETLGTQIRLQRDITRTLTGRIVASAPESQTILPSPGLSTDAGGPFAVDPSDPEGRRTIESLFVFDVAPQEGTELPYVGERALVRFEHDNEPLGFRMYRSLRQLFLNQFNV
jgi:putative peptide zinc metalloprotease protein